MVLYLGSNGTVKGYRDDAWEQRERRKQRERKRARKKAQRKRERKKQK